MRQVFFIMTLLITGCSLNQPRTLDTPFDKEILVEISLETNDISPGAYTVIINYDPSVLRIAKIERGQKDHFDGVPFFDESTFSSGQTIITSFSVKTNLQVRKPSVYQVMTITFRRINYGMTRISGKIKTLSDVNGKTIQGNLNVLPEIIGSN